MRSRDRQLDDLKTLDNSIFLLFSATPSLSPAKTYILTAEVLSRSEWPHFQIPFLSVFPRDRRVKIVLAKRKERGKGTRRKGVIWITKQLWHQLPIVRGSASHCQVWTSCSIWAPGQRAAKEGLTVMEDFPAVFPCFNKDLDSFLWETICRKGNKRWRYQLNDCRSTF